MITAAAGLLGAALLWLGLHRRGLLVGALTFSVVANASSVIENEHGVQGYILPLSLFVIGLGVWDRVTRAPSERVAEESASMPVLIGAALLGVVVLSAVIGPFVSDHPAVSAFHVELLLKDLLIVVALIVAVVDRTHLRAALLGLAAGGAACATITVAQMATGTQRFDVAGFGRWSIQGVAGAGETARAAGPFFDDPNSYAQHLAVAFGVALGFAVTAVGARLRWSMIVAASLLAVAVLGTNSRTGLLALGVMVVFAMVFRRPSRPQLVVAGGAALLVVLGPFGVGRRLATLTQVGSVGSADVDASLTGRTSEALSALRMFGDQPLFGVGFGSYPAEYLDVARGIGIETRFEERSAHSLPLEIAAEQGLVGLAAWSMLAVFVAWAARSLVHRYRSDGVAYSLGVVGFAATALFLHDVHPRIMWVLIAMAIAGARVSRHAEAGVMPARPRARSGPVIAMVIQHYVPALGGAERQLANLMPHFEAAGVRPVVITRNHPGRPAHDRVDGVTVVRIPTFGPKPLRSLLFVVRARLELRRLSPDVVHAFDTLTPSTIAIAHRRVTRTPVMTKLLRSGPRGDLAVLRRKPGGERRVRQLLRHVDLFVAISADIVEELRALGVAESRIAHIPNGVDVDRFVPIAAAALERSKAPRRRVIATGRLAPEKRLDAVAERWHRVRAVCPGAELILVGDGAQRVELEQFEGVEVLGLRDDVPDLLRSADVYLSASDAEGLSNSLLEAMACGLPCVVTDVGGVRDVIVDGVDGVVVEPDDLDRLIDEVARLVGDRDDRKALGRAARRRVRDQFSLAATATALVERYEGFATTAITTRPGATPNRPASGERVDGAAGDHVPERELVGAE